MAKFNDLLLKNVNPDKITAHLAQSKMITERELQALREIRSEIERKKTLLRMIADKGSEVYEEFVKALEKDNCSVAYCLVKEGRLGFFFNALFKIRSPHFAKSDVSLVATNVTCGKCQILQRSPERYGII